MNVCCLFEKCRRILTDQDDISEHSNHKLVTSQQILKAFENQKFELKRDLEDKTFLAGLKHQEQIHEQLMNNFIDSLICEIKKFEENLLENINILMKDLLQMKKSPHYPVCVEQYIEMINNPKVENIVKLIESNTHFNERQLKDGINDPQSNNNSININYSANLSIQTPIKFQYQIHETLQQKQATILFIEQNFNSLREDFFKKMQQWTATVQTLLDNKINQANKGFNLVSIQKKNLSSPISKVIFLNIHKDIIITSSLNHLNVYHAETLKPHYQYNFPSQILDFDIDHQKALVSVCYDQILLLINLLNGKIIRKSKISIEMAKIVCLKFFETQVCLSSGVFLEFFPISPNDQLLTFIQTLNFHSYWDRISVVDYLVLNRNGNQDMILLIGTIGGLISMFSANFKEIFAKQFHQGCVIALRFKQSQKYGKLLITAGEDMRINILLVDYTQLKCLKQFLMGSQINDILLYSDCFYITTKAFEIFQAQDDQDIVQTQFNAVGDLKLDGKDCLLNLGNKVLLIRNQMQLARLL